jgi:hypothetical protein
MLDANSVSAIMFGVGGFLILITLALVISDERSTNGRARIPWFLAVFFVPPFALGLWYFIVSRDERIESPASNFRYGP